MSEQQFEGFVSPEERLLQTTKLQNAAAEPTLSAWVSANAGSGKTFVLVKRVIRILLSGTPAHKILCLTFTKTAAAEMQNRLFSTLSQWAVMGDDMLIIEVKDVAGIDLQIDELSTARRLFAQALETPGGLKIQTIHAFCERILHIFPIEAGISPQFEVIDERTSQEMLTVIKRKILHEALDVKGHFGNSMMLISQYVNEQKFDELLGGLIKNRSKIAKLIGYDFADISAQNAPLGNAIGQLGASLKIGDLLVEADELGQDIVSYYQDILADKQHWPTKDLRKLMSLLKEDGRSNNMKLATSINAAISAESASISADKYFDIFLTKTRQPKSAKWITANLLKENPDICDRLAKEKASALVKFETLSAVKLYQASAALFEIGNAIMWQFLQKKQASSMVDYDDLINITANLLNGKSSNDKGQTAWVLFKLDNGLDHILIDEAQDTSPAQWAVIEPLVQEITAGEGAREDARSLFVVGDEKQSIYKFQGADRAEFKRKEASFEDAFHHANMDWRHIPLSLSFRSAPCVLEAVDRVFGFATAASGVYDDFAKVIKSGKLNARHFANRKVGGVVELWPIEQGSVVEPPNAWRAPVDEASPISPSRQLADKIADKIALWLHQKRKLKSTQQSIRPGDILILVRRRNDFVNALIKAIKKHNIPVAGIDRIRVRNELIVEDLISLGKFCLLPKDELTLAIILKSPMIGIDDDALFELAYGRDENLWLCLKHNNELKWQAIYKMLDKWLKMSQNLRPFDFYMQVLANDGIRKKLIARLGIDALDPLDEFLNLVETFELTHLADLSYLIKWIESDDEELKREIDQQKDEIRIMTVHGAKGLESNIVILPDTCGLPQKSRGEDLAFYFADKAAEFGNQDFAYWRPNKDIEPTLVKQVKASNYIKEIEEYHRLLYVAMTRAGDELYVAGYSKKPASDDAEYFNWYQLVKQAMLGWAEEVEDINGEMVLRFEAEGELEKSTQNVDQSKQKSNLPSWAKQTIKAIKQRDTIYSPSTLLEDTQDKIFEPSNIRISPLLAEDNQNRFLRGNIIHKLLENVPKIDKDQQNIAIDRYLQRFTDQFDSKTLSEIKAEVVKIMQDIRFSKLFSSNAQSEVSIVGKIEHLGRQKLISGQIDRLYIQDNKILILDYKSNRPPPNKVELVSKQYLGQMAAYRAILRQTYPDHKIEAALLWTYNSHLMRIDDAKLDSIYAEIFE